MRRLSLLLALFLAVPAAAQPAVADRVPEAEAAFTSGLAAFEQGEFAESYRFFLSAATDSGYNERTTAAWLMAGRAAQSEGDADRAAAAFTTLLQQYPNSRYAEDARRGLAEGPRGPAIFDLGVVLPATGEDGFLAQALFNGVRLAVDDHNALHPERPVRMVFRDSGGSGDGARAAVGSALDAGADALVGPLFSAEASAAAEVAEREEVVLIAPLATDDEVAQGRRFVFQANPTFPMRGRAMARFATGALGLQRFAVVAQSGTFGVAMANAFEDEVAQHGGTVVASERLASEDDWDRLPEAVGADALRPAEAIYLPVSGGDAPRYAADALRGLEAMRLRARPLGDAEWEGLDRSRDRASRLATAFTQDFLVDDRAAADFATRYEAMAGVRADRLALMGYDATRFLLDRLLEGAASGEVLAERMRAAPLARGLAHRIAFGGGQVNGALFLMGYRDGEAVLLE